MKLLVTLPQHDITTKYISAWAKDIIEFAKQRGIEVIDLADHKANRKDFEGRINKVKPKVIFLNGHGNNDCVFGHDNHILVKTGDNHSTLQGKITYALSCNSAANLGPEVVKDKNSTYIGYDDEFCFSGNTNYLSHPLDDPRSKPFMEASNQVMRSMLKGNNCVEACEKSKKKFREHINKLSSSLADPNSLLDAQLLWWDMKHQVYLGNEKSSMIE